MPIHLTGINIYPIKSTRRVALDEAVVERSGLRRDRRWMLVDEHGTFITQRSEPQLALVQADFVDGCMAVEAPDMPALRITLPSRGANASGAAAMPPRISDSSGVEHVQIWNDTVEAIEVSPEGSAWFSRYLGSVVRLVTMSRENGRKVDPAYAVRADDHVSFADGYPLLLASEDSLGDLNGRMDTPLPMARFRPSLVVSGGAPFAEDEWHRIRIGNLEFDVVKGCARCVVTTIDQDTAQQGKEPLRTLNRFRQRDGKVYFGQNLIPAGEGTVHLGDEVTILA